MFSATFGPREDGTYLRISLDDQVLHYWISEEVPVNAEIACNGEFRKRVVRSRILEPDHQKQEPPKIGRVALISITGRDNYADVNTNTTIRELKEELMRQEGIPSKLIRMVYGGKILEDDCTIGYYDILNDISSGLPRIWYFFN